MLVVTYEAIVTDKVSCLLFRLAVNGTEGLRKSTGVEIVDCWLSFAFLKTITEKEGLMAVAGALSLLTIFKSGFFL